MTRMKTDRPETPSELGAYDAKYWLREIEARQSELECWYDKAQEAVDRYRDNHKRSFGRLNILWANVETQKAAIGEDFGKPEVRRVNAPEGDGGLARHVALVWERTIAAAVREDDDNHDIGLAVGDVFLPGRGQVWAELDAENPKWIKAPLVRVPYDEYLEGKATRWGSVPWVARCHMFTLDDVKRECNLSEEEAKKIPLSYDPAKGRGRRRRRSRYDAGEEHKDQFKRVIAWEIWTRYPVKARLYVAEGYTEKVLSFKPDPFRLKDFFPAPRPMLASGDEGWQEPITDYSRYEDQAQELDQVCERIYVLTSLLRWRGCFDASIPDLADLLKMADTVFIGVKAWAELMAKGGLAAAIQAIDISPLMVILDGLHEQRRTLIELIYELSGISDLARGHTDPDETATATNAKQNIGSSRFRRREKESRRFAVDAYSIKAELIAEHYSREQIEAMSGINLPLRADIDKAKTELQRLAKMAELLQKAGKPPAPVDEAAMAKLQADAKCRWSWEDVSEVLESDYRRCYVCDVETDQSEFADANQDQQNRANFFNMVMMTFEKVAPMIAGNPKAGEVYKQLIMFVISSFKAGRSQEEGLEEAIDGAIQQVMQQSQQQQQPDPETQAKLAEQNARVKTAEIGLETANVRMQTEQLKQQNAGMKAQEDAQRSQIKAAEGAQKVAQSEQKAAVDRVSAAQKVEAQQQANQAKAIGHQINLSNQVAQANFEQQHQASVAEVAQAGPTLKKPKRPAKAAA